MSKLYDALQDQLKTEHKKEAEDCIKRYIMFKASIWLGVGYIMILIAIIIYLLYKQIEKY